MLEGLKLVVLEDPEILMMCLRGIYKQPDDEIRKPLLTTHSIGFLSHLEKQKIPQFLPNHFLKSPFQKFAMCY